MRTRTLPLEFRTKRGLHFIGHERDLAGFRTHLRPQRASAKSRSDFIQYIVYFSIRNRRSHSGPKPKRRASRAKPNKSTKMANPSKSISPPHRPQNIINCTSGNGTASPETCLPKLDLHSAVSRNAVYRPPEARSRSNRFNLNKIARYRLGAIVSRTKSDSGGSDNVLDGTYGGARQRSLTFRISHGVSAQRVRRVTVIIPACSARLCSLPWPST